MNALQRLRSKAAAPQDSPEAEAEVGALSRLKFKNRIGSADDTHYGQYAEINRVTALPIIRPMEPEELEDFNREHLLASAFDSGFRLFGTQANGARAYIDYQGLLGPIGVGWGKTLLLLLIASLAYRQDIRKMMMLLPPEVLPQLVNQDIKWARTKIPMPYPIHVIGGRGARERKALAKSGRRGLYIMPYSLLSARDGHEILETVQPELLMGDEAHRVANKRAARTKRLLAYIEHALPQCVFVSGTITSKSVRDYYHLIRNALGPNNPLPNTQAMAYEWGSIIDSENSGWGIDPRTGAERTGPGPLLPLVEWAEVNFPKEKIDDTRTGFRKAYRLRLNTAPGVVCSGDASIGTSLIIQNRRIQKPQQCEGWDTLEYHFKRLRDEWLTPNDDEIEHAIHCWKWEYELSAGFYNELVWPEPGDLAGRKQLTIEKAREIIDRSKEYHLTGQEYARELRKWINQYAKPGLDTPFLIGGDMANHGSKNVGTKLYAAWKAHKATDFEDRIDRDSRAVRVCDYKMLAAVEWYVNNVMESASPGALFWVYHREVGEWLTEMLREVGLPVLHCPAGKEHNLAITDPENAHRPVVASITAHGTGKNLQRFQNQIVVQWPRSAKVAEQMLGRTHRNGQTADELYVRTIATLECDDLNFAACLNDALYIHETTHNRQKMIYGVYDPTPKIFPPAVLKARGAEGVAMLTEEQQRLMKEKFS